MIHKWNGLVKNNLPTLPAAVRKTPTTRRGTPLEYADKLIRGSQFSKKETAYLSTVLERLKCEKGVDDSKK